MLKKYPDDYDALIGKGRKLKELKRNDEAEKCLQMAEKQIPSRVDAHTLLGETYLQSKMFDKAKSELLLAASIVPTSMNIHIQLASLYSHLKDFESAQREVDLAITYGPRSSKAQYASGLFLGLQKHWLESASAYRRALGFRPDYAEAVCNLGEALCMAGKVAEGRAELKKVPSMTKDAELITKASDLLKHFTVAKKSKKPKKH